MSVSLRASALYNDGGTAQTAATTITIPASAQVGDLAIVNAFQLSGTGVTMTTPSGWTLLSGQDSTGNTADAYLLAKTLVSGDPGSTLTITWSAGSKNNSTMVVLANAGSVGSLVVGTPFSTSTSPASFTTPTVTTAQTNMMILTFVGARISTAGPSAGFSVTGQTIYAEARAAYGTAPTTDVAIAYTSPNTTATGTFGGYTVSEANLTHAIAYTVAVPSAVATYNATQFLPFF